MGCASYGRMEANMDLYEVRRFSDGECQHGAKSWLIVLGYIWESH